MVDSLKARKYALQCSDVPSSLDSGSLILTLLLKHRLGRGRNLLGGCSGQNPALTGVCVSSWIYSGSLIVIILLKHRLGRARGFLGGCYKFSEGKH